MLSLIGVYLKRTSNYSPEICEYVSELISLEIEPTKNIKHKLNIQFLNQVQFIAAKTFCTDPGHPTDRFGAISVRKTCNHLKFSVREISSRAFLINASCFRRDKMTF